MLDRLLYAPFLAQIVGYSKPLADYTFDDLRRQFHTPKGCNAKCTVGCVRTSSTVDRWRAQDPSQGESEKPRLAQIAKVPDLIGIAQQPLTAIRRALRSTREERH